MRKLLSKVVIIVFLLVTWTDVNAQSLIYLEEGFEFSTLPSGWLNTGGTTSTASYRWSVFTGTFSEPAYEGNRCLRFNSYYNMAGNTNILVSPSISVTAPDTKVSFFVKNPKGGKLKVYLSTDSGQTYVHNLLDTAFTGIEDWTKKVYSLASFVDSSVCLVFFSTSNHALEDGAYHYLDNFKFYQTPICAEPVLLTSSNITSNSADISWSLDDEGGIPTAYKITVIDADNNYFLNNQSISISGSFSIFLTGLSPNTEYTVTLQSDCSSNSAGLSNISAQYTFTTLCEPVSLPYLENFDDVTSSIPECWSVSAPSSATAVTTSYKYGTSGKSLKLVSTVNQQSVVSTIQLSHAANDIEVDFMVYSTSANTPIEVGLITDPSDFSTFESLYSTTIGKASTWENHRFNTDLSQQGTNQNRSICFKVPSGSAYTVYIDQISVTSIPSCLRLEKPEVLLADSNSVTLSCVEMESSPSGNYLIECTRVLDSTITYYNSTQLPIIISGLSSQTEYSFRIKNICSNQDTSVWSNSVSCTTLCGSVSLPLIEDFNSSTTLPACWNSSISQYATSTNGSSDVGWSIYTGSTSYYIIDGYSLKSPNAGDGARYLLSLPAVQIPENQLYELVFWLYRPSVSTKECINIYVNDEPTLVGATKLDSVFRGYNLYPVETEGAKKYECFYTIPLTGTVYVMLEASFPDAYSSFRGKNFYIDNLMITPKPPCRNGVYNIQHTLDKENENILLTWSTKTSEDAWIVSTTIKENSTVIREVQDTVVFDLQYNFDYSSYIEPGVDYDMEFSVSGYCNQQDTADANTYVVSFKTTCAALNIDGSSKLFDSFEDYGDQTSLNSENTCYIVSSSNLLFKGNLGKTIYQTGNVCVPFSGSKQLAIQNNKQGDVQYKVHLTKDAKYQMSIFSRLKTDYPNGGIMKFFYYQANDSVKVYFSDDMYVSTAEWTRYLSSFVAPNTADYYIGFEYQTSNSITYLTLDDLCFKEIECELSSQCELISIGVHDATFVVPNYSGTWEIRLCDYAPGYYEEEPEALFVDTVITNFYTARGLAANTNYYYIVRALCDSVNGDWSEPQLITTNCDSKDIPYVESFETESDIRCWHEIVGRDGIVELSYSKAKKGTSSMKVQNTQIITPELNVNNLTGYMLTGWVYAQQDSASTIGFGVSIDPLDVTMYEIISNIDVKACNGWTEFTVYFDTLNTADYVDFINAKYIVISCLSNSTYYFDDVKIVPVESCTKPFDVVAEFVNNGVNLSWTPKGNESNWKIYKYKVADDQLIFMSDTIVDTTSVSLSDFEAISTYQFSVEALCSATEISESAFSNEIIIPCIPMNLPYSETCGNSELDCWNQESNGSSNWAFANYNGSRYYFLFSSLFWREIFIR
ncbi:MAG: fibronectin type III domain-containing protein [Candidatus Aphodosoma sp.]